MKTRNGKGLVLLAGGLLILTGITSLSLYSPLSAAGREGRRGMMNPADGFGLERWKEELGLSEKQIEQLRELRIELRKEHAEKALAHAQIDLGLSDEQVAAVNAVREKHFEQREAMREKHRADLEALQEKTGLTDEQIAGLGRMGREGRRPGAGMYMMRDGRGYGRLGDEWGEHRDRLAKIFTEEQMQKLDALRESRREELRDERRGDGLRDGRRGGEGRHPRRHGDCDYR
ncbi:MAG: hypothetical protein PHQ19_06565 [Candidatus Krumholzibacteria bacterium]|nr:hypothetical protein [Candidatus Krumholzibacteria bacterium]